MSDGGGAVSRNNSDSCHSDSCHCFCGAPLASSGRPRPRVLSKVYRVTVADVTEEHPARVSRSMSKHEAETKRVFGAVSRKNEMLDVTPQGSAFTSQGRGMNFGDSVNFC